MSAFTDDMYCSEQISIPPAFPYLLRQYAKAAIRTQPVDLLRWSGAYFRCLSLNIPPPVKPRLEYPVPRDYHGMTPGWLKTLLHQIQGNQTVTFRFLWDRWIGACLEHSTLIEILCLGAFEDPNAIPFMRFVALCAGHLTDDLTRTMILVCEILTEEPEGGSAMIYLETFIDLYKFLAKIDASRDQILKNLHFRDSLLLLWRQKAEKQKVVEETPRETTTEEPSTESKTSTESLDLSVKKDVSREIVSCPSLPDDDHDSLVLVEEEGHEEAIAADASEKHSDGETTQEPEKASVGSQDDSELAIQEESVSEHKSEDEATNGSKSETILKKLSLDTQEHEDQHKHDFEVATKEESVRSEDSGEASEPKPYESVETIIEEPRQLNNMIESETGLQEDLERFRSLEEELAGESDREVEKFKRTLIEETMPVAKPLEDFIEEPVEEVEVKSESTASQEKYDEVFVAAVPGVGPIVPDDLVEAVFDYMKSVAKVQHGMVMPRNIRHYSCPPLEILDY